MIGLIITGHGNFASGIGSSLELITGKQKNIQYVDFLSTDSTEDLEKKIMDALEKLSECKSGLILSDLLGGTPFKTSVVLSQTKPNWKTIYGTNLPLLLNLAVERTNEEDVEKLVEKVIDASRDQIGYFKIKKQKGE